MANRHCKILDTDKAWEQFDNLEETYFKVKENQIPKSDDEIIYIGYGKAIEKIKMLEQKIENDRPKTLFADAVASSKTSILVGELAKILKQNGADVGQNRLFEFLRKNDYLIRRQGTDYNMPTQKSMEIGLFEIKETSIVHADGHTTINKTPKVTGKGQQYLINLFLDKTTTYEV